MINSDSRILRKQQYGSLQQKNLRAVLREELMTNFGFESMAIIADTLIDRFIGIIEPYFSSNERVPGEFIWLAADVEQDSKKGASKIKLKQILLKLMADKELESIVTGVAMADIKTQQIVRLMKDSYAQGAVLSYADLSAMLGCGYNVIANSVKKYKQDHPEEFVPYRGTVHDLGPTMTHKEQAITFYMSGLLTQEIARKINHSPKNVDKYLGDWQRISELLDENYSVQKIALVTKLGKNLVEQHKLIYDKIKLKAQDLKTTRTFKIDKSWQYYDEPQHGEELKDGLS